MFSQVSVILSKRGGGVCMAGGEACLVEGMHGRGAYVVGGHAWQGWGGMHGGGGMCGRVCVVKGGHMWQGGVRGGGM